MTAEYQEMGLVYNSAQGQWEHRKALGEPDGDSLLSKDEDLYDDDVELTDDDEDDVSPDLELEVAHVKARLGMQLLKYGPDLRGMMYTHGLTPSAVEELERMRRDHVHRAAMTLADENGEIDDAALADMLGIPEDDAKKYLDELVEQSVVDNKVSPHLERQLKDVKELATKVLLRKELKEVKALTMVVKAQRGLR